MPETNGVPRKEMKPNDRQERFARVYAATLDADQALKEAGYKLRTKEAARDAKCRLLRNPTIRTFIDELLAESAKKYGMDADGTIARFKLVYLEAVQDRDWVAAVSALKELGKVYGIYKEHLKQKASTREDAERLRSELEALGMDFRKVALEPSEN